jgi:hypothetical protein
MTMITSPAARATEPAAAPAHGFVRPKASWPSAPEPARTKTGMPETRWLVVWKRLADSCGPSDRNSPPMDHDDITPRAARKNGRRTTAGTPGRCGVRRRRERSATGSGMSATPVSAMAKSTNSAA